MREIVVIFLFIINYKSLIINIMVGYRNFMVGTAFVLIYYRRYHYYYA